MLRENIEGVDLNFTNELTEKFLKIQPDQIGFDLPALIVHLGRDMGISGYTSWRQQCGLSVPKNFDELREIIRDPENILTILQQLYESVDDLDLFVMGLAELPNPGTLVGPTFACILGVQFQRLRRSDRFWYENFFFPSSFTEGNQI